MFTALMAVCIPVDVLASGKAHLGGFSPTRGVVLGAQSVQVPDATGGNWCVGTDFTSSIREFTDPDGRCIGPFCPVPLDEHELRGHSSPAALARGETWESGGPGAAAGQTLFNLLKWGETPNLADIRAIVVPVAQRRVQTSKSPEENMSMACPCFSPDTLVETEDGAVPIAEISVGTLVLAQDPDTGVRNWCPVRAVLVTPDEETISVELSVDGESETLNVTPGHPFFVESKGWTLATNLASGDQVFRSVDGFATVTRVDHALTMQHAVFNLVVEDLHTYHVGLAGVLVHNAGCSCVDKSDKRFTPEQQALVEMAKGDKQRGGVTEGDMEAYKELNAGAGAAGFPLPGAVRGPEVHPPRSPNSKPGPGQQPHGHVGPVQHIPVRVSPDTLPPTTEK